MVQTSKPNCAKVFITEYSPWPGTVRSKLVRDEFEEPWTRNRTGRAGSAALGVDCELLNVYPHMHLRGKSMVLSAVYPTGEHEEFVRVPHYDFNWQLVYSFSKPRMLPKGTLLKADATFDNSATNPFNPDPKKSVRWGDQSWDEMMVGFFDLAIPVKTDPASVLVAQ